MQKNISPLFEELTAHLESFIQEVKSQKSSAQATDGWTVKDLLCHLVFWHEYYVRNYMALVAGKEPPLFDAPLYQLNLTGVASLRKNSLASLIKRLRRANSLLHTCIVEKKVPQMTYKKNGHVYKSDDFVYMVTRHIRTHTLQVRHAK